MIAFVYTYAILTLGGIGWWEVAVILAAAWPLALGVAKFFAAWTAVTFRENRLHRYYDGKFANWSDVYYWVFVTPREDLDKSLEPGFNWEPLIGPGGGFKKQEQKEQTSEGTS